MKRSHVGMRITTVGFAAALLLLSACAPEDPDESTGDAGETAVADERPSGPAVPIQSTGADTVRDLITTDDPSTLTCLAFRETGPGEFYDKVTDELIFREETVFFDASYADGTTVEIRVHPEVADADALAERVAVGIGQLPTELRPGIERVGIVVGDATAQADGGGEGIHVYEDNVLQRIDDDRFEETLFHESVHTSLDDAHRASPAWLDAQAADGEYLTEYAASLPETEDLAESALYAWALLHRPERISAVDEAAWRSSIPNRIEFVRTLLSPPPSSAERSC